MFSKEELDQLRADTPGTLTKIHLNNAGAAMMPAPVISLIKNHIDQEGQIGGYETAHAIQDDILDFYEVTAKLINAQGRNIAFTSSATDAYARALSSIYFKVGDIILTSTNDYASNFIAFISLGKRYGIKIELIKNNQHGLVDLEDLDNKLKTLAPRLLAITHIPTNSGLIQPVEAIGEVVKKYDTLYLVDGCQSIGQLAIDTKKLHCHFFSATFRKFLRGPRGAGFLYVSDDALNQGYAPLYLDMLGANWIEKDVIEMRSDAKRFEEWEKPYALMMGGRACIRYLLDVGVDRIAERCQNLAILLRSQLSQIAKIRVLDRGLDKAALVTFHVQDSSAEKIKSHLSNHHINCSTVVPSSALLDFQEKKVAWAVRLSPHYYNTEEEIDIAMEVMHVI